jgi:hypothetical protein
VVPELGRTVSAEELPRHGQQAGAKVDVGLPEAEQFPLAESGVDGGRKQGRHLGASALRTCGTSSARRKIELEIAAAVEGMETRRGYERQTEIVTTGLLARHGARPPADRPTRLQVPAEARGEVRPSFERR